LQEESVVAPETRQAYRETDYRIEVEPPVVLHIEEPSPALVGLYKAHRAETCVFITACNPNGEMLPDSDNLKLQDELARELQVRSLKYLLGVGRHPVGDWPGEASFLVFGLSLEASKTLGRKFQQNAIVWCGPDAIPQLLVLR
jgi:hypothetical protein